MRRAECVRCIFDAFRRVRWRVAALAPRPELPAVWPRMIRPKPLSCCAADGAGMLAFGGCGRMIWLFDGVCRRRDELSDEAWRRRAQTTNANVERTSILLRRTETVSNLNEFFTKRPDLDDLEEKNILSRAEVSAITRDAASSPPPGAAASSGGAAALAGSAGKAPPAGAAGGGAGDKRGGDDKVDRKEKERRAKEEEKRKKEDEKRRRKEEEDAKRAAPTKGGVLGIFRGGKKRTRTTILSGISRFF
jgi:hypothetical protein